MVRVVAFVANLSEDIDLTTIESKIFQKSQSPCHKSQERKSEPPPKAISKSTIGSWLLSSKNVDKDATYPTFSIDETSFGMFGKN